MKKNILIISLVVLVSSCICNGNKENNVVEKVNKTNIDYSQYDVKVDTTKADELTDKLEERAYEINFKNKKNVIYFKVLSDMTPSSTIYLQNYPTNYIFYNIGPFAAEETSNITIGFYDLENNLVNKIESKVSGKENVGFIKDKEDIKAITDYLLTKDGYIRLVIINKDNDGFDDTRLDFIVPCIDDNII